MTAPNQRPSDWERLFRIACSLIDQVNGSGPIIDHWTLGGGTAMMLRIGHRESRDVDIFFHDPQYLGFLNPETRDFVFESMPSDTGGDGSRFLKFAFGDLGEIDFIVAPELTDEPATEREIAGVPILLETVPEIVTKKVYFRGASITPRDIFDLAVAGGVCGDEVLNALKQYPEQVESTLSRIEQLNPEFVYNAISQLMILDNFKDIARSSLEEAKKLLNAVV